MDPLVYVAAAVIVGILLAAVTLLSRSSTEGGGNDDGAAAAAPRVPRAAGAAGGDVARAGGRRVVRRRLERRQVEDSDEEENELMDDIALPDGKVGAKKLAKLQAKAEKKQNREAELQEREEKKKREDKREEQRKKEEAKQEKIEKEIEEEEARRKKEEEEREHEEYLKMKAMFTVDEEGTHEAELNQDTESLLQEFIRYIKEMKVIMLEDLASHFKIRTQDAIDRVTTLLEEGTIQGVLDDRGKFIYITQEEFDAVAKFIHQRGRVSITELAESSNRLINMNPDNHETLTSLVGAQSG